MSGNEDVRVARARNKYRLSSTWTRECERSASVLRRLNSYNYACVHGALLHIHYDANVDLDEVVDCYARLHPRRLELESILL